MKQPKKNPAFILAIEIVLGLVMSIVSFVFFVEITERVLASSGYVDSAFARFVYDLRTPRITIAAEIITLFGNEFVLLGGAVLFVALTWKNHRREAILFAVALVMGALVNWLLKELIQRPRPAISPLAELQSYSFPSGHAMNAFVFYALLSRFIYRLTPKIELGFLVTFLSFFLIILVGFSRIYLGVHYLSDVLAGFIAGFWIIVTALVMERTLMFYRLFRGKARI